MHVAHFGSEVPISAVCVSNYTEASAVWSVVYTQRMVSDLVPFALGVGDQKQRNPTMSLCGRWFMLDTLLNG